MRQINLAGVYLEGRGCTRRDDSEPSDDRVGRPFDPTEADRLWVMDVTEHLVGEGTVYPAVVLDPLSRRVVGWSVADHFRSGLVVSFWCG